MQNDIIAFYSPYPGAGKTTAQTELLYWPPDGRGVMTESFAEPIKDSLINIFGSKVFTSCDTADKGGPMPEFGFSARDAMIHFGESFKALDPDIWVKVLMRKVRMNQRRGFLTVIDDLRFPNEYAALRNAGAILIRIEREGVKRERIPSEGLLDDFDFDATILNNTTCDVYKKAVRGTVRALLYARAVKVEVCGDE